MEDDKALLVSIESITITPQELELVPTGHVTMVIANGNEKKITFKLKATKPKSIFPRITHGTIDAKGQESVRIAYKPKPDETPFSAKDHLTILVSLLPDGSKVEDFWNSPAGKKTATRFVVNLKKKE